jgi:hypothetical protein
MRHWRTEAVDVATTREESMRVTLAAAAATVGLTCVTALAVTSAQAQGSSGDGSAKQCFASSEVSSFNAPNDRTLFIRVGANAIYRLDLAAGCNELAFRQDIGLQSTPPGDPFICSPIQTEVTYSLSGIRQRCQVIAMRKLTAAEVAALPKRSVP